MPIPSFLAKSLGRLAVMLGIVLHAQAFALVAEDRPAPVPTSPLPLLLSDFDVQQYQRLFDLQEQGRMKQAIREIGRLETRS